MQCIWGQNYLSLSGFEKKLTCVLWILIRHMDLCLGSASLTLGPYLGLWARAQARTSPTLDSINHQELRYFCSFEFETGLNLETANSVSSISKDCLYRSLQVSHSSYRFLQDWRNCWKCKELSFLAKVHKCMSSEWKWSSWTCLEVEWVLFFWA